MNITVLGETYEVSEPVGRKYHALMANGHDELDAVSRAIDDPYTIEPTTSRSQPTFNIPNITITPEFHLQPPEVNVTVPEPVVNYTPPAINVPAPMIIQPAAKMNEGVQDVRIVADIQPRKEKQVIRGAPTRSNPDGPIQGIVE